MSDSTQSFVIKYSFQEIELNEVSNFNLTIDIPKVNNSEELKDIKIPVMMQVALYYSKINKDETCADMLHDQVCSRKLWIGDAVKGIYSFVPIEFNDSFSSSLCATVHWWINKFSFYKRPKLIPSQKEHLFQVAKCKVKSNKSV